MKRLVFGFAIATVIAAGTSMQGQHGGNPFVDHSDTGETVHILPAPAAVRSPHDTQPTDAPVRQGAQVYGASYGSGNLVNHGGRQIPDAGFYAIYWNSAVANSPGSQGFSTLHDEVKAFVENFGSATTYDPTDSAADYSIVQQYSGLDTIGPSLAFRGEYFDEKPVQTFSDSKVQSYLASLITSTKIPLSTNTVFGVYFPSGMRINLQGGMSCSSFCGYHGHFMYAGNDIKYAVFPYTDCRACSLPGKKIADILTIVSSHEIREAVTDPDLNAWFDNSGYEADDKCAWHNLYQTKRVAPAIGGFWVQPEYSNGGGTNPSFPGPGCVVP